jgi:hypothetical protein
LGNVPLIFYYFSKTCFEFLFLIKILLKFYPTFYNFVSRSLNHPNIILKTNFLDIHNFEYNKEKYNIIQKNRTPKRAITIIDS